MNDIHTVKLFNLGYTKVQHIILFLLVSAVTHASTWCLPAPTPSHSFWLQGTFSPSFKRQR